MAHNRRHREKGNMFDSIEPDLQTPNQKVFRLGFDDNPWSQLHATSGRIDQLDVGSISVDGSGLASSGDGYNDAVYQEDGAIMIASFPPTIQVAHNLGTVIVNVITYDAVTSGIFIPNSVTPINENVVEITLVEPQPMIVLIQRGKVF
jgi:hypothetical protein